MNKKYDTKLTNPKDVIGSMKLPTHLAPDTIKMFAALAFCEGALKYGTHNWRAAGVRSSIYRAALDRHIAKWWNGEDVDPKTQVPHLASALACIGIILDAQMAGKLTDDRPPKNMGLLAMIDAAEEAVKHLKQTFAEHSPRHWNIGDTEEIRDADADAELAAELAADADRGEHNREQVVALAWKEGDAICGTYGCGLRDGHGGLHVPESLVEAVVRDVAASSAADADRGEPHEGSTFDRGEPGMTRVGRSKID